jgi:hypothetical protein
MEAKKDTNFFLITVFLGNKLIGAKEQRAYHGNHGEMNKFVKSTLDKHSKKTGIPAHEGHFTTSPIFEDENGKHFFYEWKGHTIGYKKTFVDQKINSISEHTTCPNCGINL